MRILITVLILILGLQSFIKAEDISEFEIEGISIGDSGLKHFTMKQLINDKTYYYKNKKYAGIIYFDNLKIYDDLQITFDPNDKNLKIVAIEGGLLFKENIEDCYKKQNEIVKDFEKIFPNLKKISYEQPHDVDKSGNSKGKAVDFEFKNRDSIRVICMDWSEELSKKNNWFDNLSVSVITNQFLHWVTNHAY